MNRRHFIKAVGVSGGAALVGCAKDDPSTASAAAADATATPDIDSETGDTSGSPDAEASDTSEPASPRIVILGAGLAGLSAAIKLMDEGYDVTLLEGQAEPGGRVKTKHDGFAPGFWAEMGAIRVPDAHILTQKYMASYKVKLAAYPAGISLNYLKTLRFVREEGDAWPPELALTELEKTKGFSLVQQDYIRKYFQEMLDDGDPKSAEWPSESLAAKYDDQDFVAFLKAQGASDDFITMYRADVGSEIDVANALSLLGAFALDKNWNQTYTAEGGLDQLPKAMAEKLGDRIRYGHKVTAVAWRADGATVTAVSGDADVSFEADHVVCAFPPTLVKQLAFEPALPSAKATAFAEAKMMAASRLYLQTKSRFWTKETFNGTKTIGGLKLVRTDTPIERLWDVGAVMGERKPEDPGLLMAYMQHDNARDFAAVLEADRASYVTDIAKDVFPALEAELETPTWNKAWQDDPWAGGGWYAPEPGQVDHRAAMAGAEGRLHFAGEHTSIWNGWMQGALESGERVAAEILVAGGRTTAVRMNVRELLHYAFARLFS